MLYGLTGAHRSGKTTLGRRLSEDLGIRFHATNTTEVCRRHGYDQVGPLTLTDRVKVQYLLLENHLEELRRLPRPLIVDRTPLDYLGYMYAEFHMLSHLMVDPAVLEQANKFYDLCLEAARLNYDMIYYLAPLEHYTVEDGKPAHNPVFQRHHAMLVRAGLAAANVNYVIINETDFNFRLSWVGDHITKRIDEIQMMANSAPFH